MVSRGNGDYKRCYQPDQLRIIKANPLSSERIQRLNELGFAWDPNAERWKQGFSELAIFKEEFGHCRVLRSFNTASNYTLGSWVSKQRTAYNKDQLTPERIQRLGDLGFVWKVK